MYFSKLSQSTFVLQKTRHCVIWNKSAIFTTSLGFCCLTMSDCAWASSKL